MTSESNPTTPNATATTLVLGSTGRTGHRVMDRLAALGFTTRAGSRHGNPPFDWQRPAGWPAVLDGVDAAYLCYHPDLAVTGAVETVGAFARTAVDAGVSRLVLLSGRGEHQARRAEDLVGEAADGSAATLTVVRASWFAQNFSEGFFRDDLLAREVALPVGDVREPFIDIVDIADVVTAALTDPRHAGQVYEVTGPRLLTFRQAIDEIAEASGQVITTVTVPLTTYLTAMADAGVPPEVTELMAYLFTEVLDGRNASIGDGVERALGRAPRDFTEFARRAAAAGAFDGASAGVR